MENLGLIKPVKPGRIRRALDLGCGKGQDSEYLESQGYSVCAVDRENHYEKAVIGDICHFDIGANTYSVIICNNVLPFIKEKSYVRSIVSHIVTGLKKGGAAFITFYGPHSGRFPDPEMSFYTFSEATKLIQSHDVKIMDMTTTEGYSKNGRGEIIYQHSHRFILKK